jgi:hypothetical protein
VALRDASQRVGQTFDLVLDVKHMAWINQGLHA